jgi:two-component system sensor histidine kinase BaeS
VTVSRRDELGRLGLSFNRMAEDLEAQESLRRKLVADVAHELRTPLGIMRGEIEAMIDGMMAVDEKRLQSLYDETSRLKRMVEGIEDLNQAERSVLYLKRQRFPLKPFLSDIVDRFRVIAGPGKTISWSVPNPLRPMPIPNGWASNVNLVSNAVRAVYEAERYRSRRRRPRTAY